MQWTDRIRQVKIVLLVSAVVIAAVSLVISYLLVRDLSHEERNRMVVWAEAMRSLSRADENTDIYLALKVIDGNNTIPVIVLDAQGNVETYRNITIKAETAADTLRYLQQRAEAMRQAGYAIDLNLTDAGQDVRPGDDYLVICYEESSMLRRLASYPYVQLGVVGLFVVVAIFALLSSKRAEQNRVWVGLSKETAHQLGTPISSLMAWTAILREAYPEDELIPEMDKDVKRLELIADRFSKIGSQPEVAREDLRPLLVRTADYIRRRSSDKVVVACDMPKVPVDADVCAPLFEWVVENLCKNAIDAMSGKGSITIRLRQETAHIVIEVSDTGKGISKRHFKTVFSPGYTTKKRGWGLGLSLAKRIVEEYHKGHIFVKNSELGVGTTFRIELHAPSDGVGAVSRSSAAK